MKAKAERKGKCATCQHGRYRMVGGGSCPKCGRAIKGMLDEHSVELLARAFTPAFREPVKTIWPEVR